MSWLNIDDEFADHPKIAALSDGAFRLHVAAMCFAKRKQSDGLIHADDVPRLVRRFRRAALDELLSKKLWHDQAGCGTDTCVSGAPGHYVIHDFLQWNEPRKQVEDRRERKRAAGRKGALGRWGA